MTIREIHIAIDQGLQSIGAFETGSVEHEEIDIAINAVVYKLITSIFKDRQKSIKNFEGNQFYTDFLRLLKLKYSSTPIKTDDGYKINLPSDYLHLISDSSQVIAKKCKFTVRSNDLKISNYYIVVDNASHNGVWYEKDDIFVAVNKFVYGKVRELITANRTNRLTKSEDIPDVLNGKFSKSVINSPISELVGNELQIYTNDFEIAKINITYIKKPTPVNYNTNVTLIEFAEDIQKYIVEQTVQHLMIRGGQDGQQKIVNMKTENLEFN